MIKKTSWDERPVMFLGHRLFFLLIGIINLVLFLASSIYVGLSSWRLLVIVLPVAIVLGWFLVPRFVLRFIIFPPYLIYSGFSGLFKSNYTRIAESTTKYYLELTRNHRDRFDSEVALLATTGVLDAHVYVFIEGSISLETIIRMAERAVGTGDDGFTAYQKVAIGHRYEELQKLHGKSPAYILTHPLEEKAEFEKDFLFNLVFDLEVEIFKAESPRLYRTQIAEACFSRASSIFKAIRKTQEGYQSDALFASATANFMNATEPSWLTIRKQLGIKE